MKSLIRLIRSLKAVEIKFIQDYYKSKALGNSKRLLLFNLIVEGYVKNSNDAIRQIYSGKSNAISSLSHLKKKLTDDIMNLILVISPESESSMEYNQEFMCKKYLLQCEILMSKGLHTEGMSLLDKTIRLAEKYEFPYINLSSYNVLFNYFPKVEIQHLNCYFDKAIDNYRTLLKVKEAYIRGDEAIGVSFTEGAVTKVESKRVYYWYQLYLLNTLCNQCSFEEAKIKAFCLYDFLREEKFIYSGEKEARLCKVLSEILLHLNEQEHAVTYARKACDLFDPYSPDYQASLIVLFFSYLRNSNFVEAENLYNSSIRQKSLNDSIKYKWNLLKATLEFYTKNFKKVYTTLAKWDCKCCDDLSWSLSPRILELITILEIEDYDWYVYRFECFRKKLSNTNIIITERMKLVYQLLQSLIKSCFDYDAMVDKEQDNFNKLNSNSPAFYWNPIGYELINIPQWILNKSNHSQFKSVHY